MDEARKRAHRDCDITIDGENRRPRKSFLMANSFEVAIAFAALLTSTQFILDPSLRSETAIGFLGPTSSWLWTALYLLGALGILWGLFRSDDRIEIAGLSCFTAACLINAFGLWQIRGDRALYIAFTFVALGLGGLFRVRFMIQLRRASIRSKVG